MGKYASRYLNIPVDGDKGLCGRSNAKLSEKREKNKEQARCKLLYSLHR